MEPYAPIYSDKQALYIEVYGSILGSDRLRSIRTQFYINDLNAYMNIHTKSMILYIYIVNNWYTSIMQSDTVFHILSYFLLIK